MALAVGFLAAGPAPAFEPVRGTFLAGRECPATIGIRSAPDGVSLRPGQGYAALGLNRPDGDHLQVRVPGARPEPRWVARSCGDWPPAEAAPVPGSTPSGAPGAGAHPPPGPSASPTPGGQARRLLLALSWQPAFCERQPSKPECRDPAAAGDPAGGALALHGLWPQPQGLEYCRVDADTRALDQGGHWLNLPAPTLGEDTLRRLRRAMPGTESGLERHEWLRHGTCFGADPDTYFRTAMALRDQVGRSPLNAILVRRMGSGVALSELQTAFEQGFGPGAGRALGIRCQPDGARRLIQEIRLALKSPVTETTPLAAALDRDTRERSNCPGGIVDAPGPD